MNPNFSITIFIDSVTMMILMGSILAVITGGVVLSSTSSEITDIELG